MLSHRCHYSSQYKHRRLWRLAVATQPTIAEQPVSAVTPHPLLVPQSGTDYHPQHHSGCVSPPSGNDRGGGIILYPQLRCFAACSGFHDIGPASRNPQLILNLLPFVAAWLPYHNAQSTITSFACVRGCVATARRHSLLRLPFFCCASLHMSSYLKNMFFMSSCQKKHVLHVYL